MDVQVLADGVLADRSATTRWAAALRAQRQSIDAQIEAAEQRLVALNLQLRGLGVSVDLTSPVDGGGPDGGMPDTTLLLAFDQPQGLSRDAARQAARLAGRSPQVVGGLANGGWVVSVEDAQGEIRRFLTDRSYAHLENRGVVTPNRLLAIAARDAAPVRANAPV